MKHFSCSTQLSMKFELLINITITKFNDILRLKPSNSINYAANECKIANNFWHFNIYEQDKFHAHQS